MIETDNEVFGAYCPSNGVMAAISNDEVSVAYSYSDDLLDTGYAISVAGGETVCRAVSRHDHVGDMVLSVTNSTPVATNGWHYYHDNCRRPVSRNADAFAYNSRGEVTNAVVAGVAEAHAYDAAGNPIYATRNAQSHSYGATDFELVVSNRYDYLDRRVQKITPEATHTYFYDGWMLIGGTQEQTDIGGAHNGKMYLREDRGDA